MRSPILSKAWRMPGIVALGATMGISGFLAGEAVLASRAQADARVSERAFVARPWANPVRRERIARSNEGRARPFRNCAAARAAGAAPVYYGDPDYGEHLDGDLDGIGCEPYRR